MESTSQSSLQPNMKGAVKRVFRTLQSEFPLLKEAKDGLYLYSRRILRVPHEKDFEVMALIPPSAPGCFIDVGANHGQSIESILLFRPDAQIISFEANPGLAQKLEARYRDRQNVRIVAQGLADSAGRFTLYVPSYKGFVYDGLASFDEASAASWISERTILNFRPHKLRISRVSCVADTLDAQRLAPIFVKVDVQGYEYNVLDGGRQTLLQYEPILLIEDFRSDARTIGLAEELGYEEYHYDGTVLRKGQSRESSNSFLMTRGRAQKLAGFP
jgi:FkbM family methyltransferase